MKHIPVPQCDKIKTGYIYSDIYNKRIDQREVDSFSNIHRAKIVDGELVFKNKDIFSQALVDGLFYLKIPDWINVSECEIFSDNFYKEREEHHYGGYRKINSVRFNDPLLGFHQRTNQIEQFLLERRYWKEIYPDVILQAGENFTILSKIIIDSVLRKTDIPADEWEKVTGGCSACSGSYHFTFNHYRPEEEGLGLASHKDDGFLTILYNKEEGLEINNSDKWEKVLPLPGYLIINFGLSMEILTCDCAMPVKSILHRVRHQLKDRSSFGHFTSSNCMEGRDAGIYRYSSAQGVEKLCNSRTLINANDHEIYDGTHPPAEGEMNG